MFHLPNALSPNKTGRSNALQAEIFFKQESVHLPLPCVLICDSSVIKGNILHYQVYLLRK